MTRASSSRLSSEPRPGCEKGGNGPRCLPSGDRLLAFTHFCPCPSSHLLSGSSHHYCRVWALSAYVLRRHVSGPNQCLPNNGSGLCHGPSQSVPKDRAKRGPALRCCLDPRARTLAAGSAACPSALDLLCNEVLSLDGFSVPALWIEAWHVSSCLLLGSLCRRPQHGVGRDLSLPSMLGASPYSRREVCGGPAASRFMFTQGAQRRTISHRVRH